MSLVPRVDAEVLGSDIDRNALQVARRGLYRRRSLRGAALPPWLIARDDDQLHVSCGLRAQVRFAYLNLHDPVYPPQDAGTAAFDLIFCRNVLVYLTPAAGRAVLQRLADCLADGGYLVVGPLDLDLAPPALECVRHGALTVLRRAPTEARA
jgi:chemotaxis protein methyltransferase CheR